MPAHNRLRARMEKLYAENPELRHGARLRMSPEMDALCTATTFIRKELFTP